VDPEGKALVTGASRGIGRVLALELCARGFDVVATMRDPAAGSSLIDEAAGSPGSLVVERLDVTDADTIVIPDGLRVLVNNAAIESENLPVEETTMAAWRAVFDTNVFGVVEVTRRAIPSLRRSGGGVICNITTGGLLVPMPFFGVYRASKGAVSALGETLRAELAPFGIRVVEILPGPIETDMLAASQIVPEAAAFEPYRILAEQVGETRARTTLGGTAVEVAASAIADAILDDEGPLRYSCDPLGDGLLEIWRARTDEAHQSSFLDAFAIDPWVDERND
jgi:NAD(P)-dependent dehydrogenase (short-subunit alcohol dehydrogenase family)